MSLNGRIYEWQIITGEQKVLLMPFSVIQVSLQMPGGRTVVRFFIDVSR